MATASKLPCEVHLVYIDRLYIAEQPCMRWGGALDAITANPHVCGEQSVVFDSSPPCLPPPALTPSPPLHHLHATLVQSRTADTVNEHF